MSFIYSMECEVCHEDIATEAFMDEDKDIIMTVTPCKTCMENAVKEGLKDGERIYKPKEKTSINIDMEQAGKVEIKP